jgi:DNA-binding MarR family transcriptional regulator
MDFGYIPEECIGFGARAAARAAIKLLDERLEPLGLRATQFSVLIAVNQLPEASVAAVARALDIEASALLRNLDVLKRDGLVTSNGKRGRGGQALLLTDEGKALLKKAARVWRKTQDELAEALGAKTNRIRQALRAVESAARQLQHKENA